MKKLALIPLLALVLMPISALAHESQTFEIGGKTYQFVIGSLNEPVVVDDKTGVDLRVTDLGAAMSGMHEEDEDGHDHGSGSAVSGLEETLKVELIAGDKKKTLDLSPVYNTPGAYKAPFYPTVATTYSYRVFGTLNNTPIDLTFSCNPAGHGEAKEDTSRVEISDGVARVKKTGAFGCPQPKGGFGFPEESADIASLKSGSGAGGMATAALALSVVALVLAGLASRRKN